MALVRASLPLIPLRPFPLASILLMSIILAGSLVIIGIRTYVRSRDNTFGLDDAFVLVGTIFYIASTALGIICFLSGSGGSDSGFGTGLQKESFKYFFIWTLVYALALAILVSSISLTFRRITNRMNKHICIAAYALLAMAWWFYGVVVVGAFLSCGPAGWDSEAEPCASDRVLVLGQVGIISTTIMDVLIITLPTVLLWRWQVNQWKKWQMVGMVSFGVIAFIFTCIQIPYTTKASTSITENEYWHGVTILLSNVELGVGCIATSVPAVRWTLFARRLPGHFQSPSDIEQMSLSLLEMREAEGWGLHRQQSRSHCTQSCHALNDKDDDDFGIGTAQSPATPSYPSIRTVSSNLKSL